MLGLVADGAHSFGATYRGAPVGCLADATTLSFHPVKSITTAEGGAILTDSDAYARAARRFRNHGIVREPEDLLLGAPGAWYYEVQSLGLNYRLPDVLCALGLSQLAKLDTFMHRRRALARRYQEALADVPGLQQPVTRPDVESAWHLYAVRVDDRLRRDAFFSRLRASGIGAQVHYIPAYAHPAIAALGYRARQLPRRRGFRGARSLDPALPEARRRRRGSRHRHDQGRRTRNPLTARRAGGPPRSGSVVPRPPVDDLSRSIGESVSDRGLQLDR